MFINPNTFSVTIMAIVIGLIVLFWHERIAGYLAGTIGPNNDQFQSKLDEVLFIASIIIVAIFTLWLLRIVAG
jgi:hypothetical protein